jgi:hypothetical protein
MAVVASYTKIRTGQGKIDENAHASKTDKLLGS